MLLALFDAVDDTVSVRKSVLNVCVDDTVSVWKSVLNVCVVLRTLHVSGDGYAGDGK